MELPRIGIRILLSEAAAAAGVVVEALVRPELPPAPRKVGIRILLSEADADGVC